MQSHNRYRTFQPSTQITTAHVKFTYTDHIAIFQEKRTPHCTGLTIQEIRNLLVELDIRWLSLKDDTWIFDLKISILDVPRLAKKLVELYPNLDLARALVIRFPDNTKAGPSEVQHNHEAADQKNEHKCSIM